MARKLGEAAQTLTKTSGVIKLGHICSLCRWHGDCDDETEAEEKNMPIENCGDYEDPCKLVALD